MTISDNRITSPLTVANAEEDKRVEPTVSPTGLAVLPQLAVKVALVLVTVAGAVLSLSAAGISLPPVVVTICTAVVTLGTSLGIASQGIRK